MDNFNKTSFTIVTGTVISSIKHEPGPPGSLARFTLRNPDGVVVLVKATQHLVSHLQKSDHVSVVGYLASQHSRCGSQLFLRATVILATSYPRLWDDIGVPALLRTIYALGKIS